MNILALEWIENGQTVKVCAGIDVEYWSAKGWRVLAVIESGGVMSFILAKPNKVVEKPRKGKKK